MNFNIFKFITYCCPTWIISDPIVKFITLIFDSKIISPVDMVVLTLCITQSVALIGIV